MPFRRREEDPKRSRRPSGPPPARRREPEEEAPQESTPVRSSFRRDMPASESPWRREWEPGPGPRAEPFQERSYGGGERKRELWEYIVPESERQDPYFDYGKVFEVLRPSPRGAERPRPEAGPGPAYARREGGAPPPPPQESRRAARGREGPPTVDPRNWFDTQAIWDAARRVRADSRFRPGSPVALVQVAPASRDEATRANDLIRFFRIPKQEVERYDGPRIWSELLHPLLDEMSYAFNTAKPQDLPGQFAFQSGKDGSFWLAYME